MTHGVDHMMHCCLAGWLIRITGSQGDQVEMRQENLLADRVVVEIISSTRLSVFVIDS